MNDTNNNLTETNSPVTNYKNQEIIQIPLSIIKPNPYQPRLVFSDDKISALASSIAQYGVLQPIVVTKKVGENNEETFEIIAGERRYRASKIAGLKTIPAVIASDKLQGSDKFELAIIENIQREDLNPVDKAKAFRRLHEEFSLTHSQIAEKMGKSREYVSNSVRLLDLPDKILDGIVKGEITEGHSKPLLILKDRPFEQNILFEKIKDKKLTVRAADTLAKKLLSGEKEVVKTGNESSEYKIIEKKLSEKLGTKVSINTKEQGEGGKVTIEFFSQEDLDKIVSLVRGKGLADVNAVLDNKVENEVSENVEQKVENIGQIGKTASATPAFFADEISEAGKNSVKPEVESKKVFVENEGGEEQILAEPKSASETEAEKVSEPVLESEVKVETEIQNENTSESLETEKQEVKEAEAEKTESENNDDLDGFNIASFLHKGEATKVIEDENSDPFKEDVLKAETEKQEEIENEVVDFGDEKIDNFGGGTVASENKQILSNTETQIKSAPTPEVPDAPQTQVSQKMEIQEEVKADIQVEPKDILKPDFKVETNTAQTEVQKENQVSYQDDQVDIDDIFSYSKPVSSQKTEVVKPVSQTEGVSNIIPQAQNQNPVEKTQSRTNEFAKGDLMLDKDKLSQIEHEKSGQTVFGEQNSNQQKINEILAQKYQQKEQREQEEVLKQSQNVSDNQNEQLQTNRIEASSNIENSSMYQEFLKSKERIAEQQKRVFSGEKPAFSGETSEFISSQGVVDDVKTELKADDYKDPVSEAIEQMKNVSESFDSTEDVSLVNNGSDFIPKGVLENKTSIEKQEELGSKNNENIDEIENQKMKDGFGNFSL